MTKASLMFSVLTAVTPVPDLPPGEIIGEAQVEIQRAISPEVCRAYSEKLDEGDLIFIAARFALFEKVARASNSWASHVGIVFQDAGGQWTVYESKISPGRVTPLCTFLGRAGKGQTAIARLKKKPGRERMGAVKAWASNPANHLPYDLGFEFNEPGSSFCSKFVHHAYQAAGVSLGKTQTLQELLDAFEGSSEERDSLVRFFKLYMLRLNFPWQRVTLTPASVMRDPKLVVTEVHVD